jgi:hypothetical protein
MFKCIYNTPSHEVCDTGTFPTTDEATDSAKRLILDGRVAKGSNVEIVQVVRTIRIKEDWHIEDKY